MTGSSVEGVFKHPHKRNHSVVYLQQLLGILQEVQTVFNPTSRNFCPLLSEFFPALTLRLTWVKKKDRKCEVIQKDRN